MSYSLGVDLGTTFVAAAVAHASQVEMFTLGDRSVVSPAAVYAREDGVLVSGEASVRRAVSRPDRVSREFKRRLGDPTPVFLGGSEFPVSMLLGAVLRDVVDRVGGTEGVPPERLVLTHPANWGPYRRELFDEVPESAGLHSGPTTVLRAVTEPEAAAAHYAAARRLAEDDTVAVYDLGGGTFDATVLRKKGDGIEILGTPEGIERLGGVDFDEAILSYVNYQSGNALTELDLGDLQTSVAMARLRQDCVLAKEALSVDTETTIPVFLPQRHFDVRLTLGDFEGMIRAQVESTIGALTRTLHSAGVAPAELGSVLLVGGSSRIPLVARMLSEELGRPIVVDAHPKYAVALGAAELARGDLSASGAGGAAARVETVPPPERRSAAPGAVGAAGAAGAVAAAGAAGATVGRGASGDAQEPGAQRADRAAAGTQTSAGPAGMPRPAEGGVPRPAEHAAGIPRPAEPSGTPGRAGSAGLPRPGEAAGTPRPGETAGMPRPGGTAGMPRPGESAGMPRAAVPAAEMPRPGTWPPPASAAAAPASSTPAGSGLPSAAPPPANGYAYGTSTNGSAGPPGGPAGAGGPVAAPQPDPQAAGGGAAPPPGPPTTVGDPAPLPEERPRRRSRLLAVAVVAVLVLAAGAVYLGTGGFGLLLGDSTATEPAAPEGVAVAVPIPTLGGTVPAGPTSGFVVVSPNGRLAYVANRAAGVVTVIDTSVNREIATIEVPEGPPQYLAFAPDGRHVYVSVFDEARTIATVAVLDTTTNSVVATVPVQTRPFALAVTPDGSKVYVPNHDSGTVSVIDTATNRVASEIKVAPNPHWVAITPDGTRFWTANHESNLISALDTSDDAVVAEVPVERSPHSVAVNPVRPMVANVNYDSASVSFTDTGSNTVLATVPVRTNPQAIAWSRDGRFAYTANVTDNTVSVISADTFTVTATLPVGNGPTSIAVLPNGKKAYVSNLKDGTLTILDLAAG
ncbi:MULTISPECIES: Hsp70 family protein [unclassified Pseudonocardia]|uniref:Hsp70 family protein n=1 Tax=unclassified Pseudonocardia TaxID=2619320 RepID=UPI00076102D9|nr:MULTISPECIES: Hsp70 family protein [unclassified Pseudonocardia]